MSNYIKIGRCDAASIQRNNGMTLSCLKATEDTVISCLLQLLDNSSHIDAYIISLQVLKAAMSLDT